MAACKAAGMVAGTRACHCAASTSTSKVPVPASRRTISPSCTRASGPPAAASGETWMAAGTLPEAPLIRPSVTKATAKPLFCRIAKGGVSLCSSGMPLACGPCQRTTHTTSRSNSPTLNAACSASWESNTRQGACTTWRSAGTEDTLMTLRPSGPCKSFKPPLALKGSLTGRTTDRSPLAPASRQASAPCASACGMRVNACRPSGRTVRTSACSKPTSRNSRITKPWPPAAWNWFTSALPLGYTRVSVGTTSDRAEKSSQSMTIPAARATATQ